MASIDGLSLVEGPSTAISGTLPDVACKVVVVEPLARSTGHQTWFACNLVRSLTEAGSSPALITFDGMHEDVDLELRERGCDVRRVSSSFPGWIRWIVGKITGIELGTTAAPSVVRWSFQMYLYNQMATTLSVLYASRTSYEATPILHFLCPPLWITLRCFTIARRSGVRAVITAFDTLARFRGSSNVVPKLCRDRILSIVVQTDALRADWVSQVSPETVRVIPLPSANRARKCDAKDSRRLLGMPDGKPILAVIGNISPRKGYIELFHAVRGLPRNFRILLAGDTGVWTSPDPADIAQEAGWLADTIIRRKFVPEQLMPSLFSAIDAVALLYREPNASSGILCLCQQYGVPVIATRFGEIGTKVRSENLGLTVDPNDSTEVAEAVRRIFTMANEPGRKDGSGAGERFSWEDVAAAHLRLYSDVRNK